ncbi:MAG TPA: glycosyltransferase family 4 protein [Steroidobacteraceae bacterium]|nr:glycosyltransferase family 4 protein [Steroidobacteraceae bacterium]
MPVLPDAGIPPWLEATSAADRRFRIAMVAACPMPARRGTPLRVERLAEALAARGHHVELVTYHVADGPQPLDFPVHRIFRRPVYWRMPVGPSFRKLALYDPALSWKLLRVLAGRRFDVIHAHHVEGLLVALPVRLRHRMPLIYDAHTMLSAELPSYAAWLARGTFGALGGWLDGALPRRADHVVAVTSDIRDRLVAAHGLEPGRVSVVTNGVETGCFRVESPPRQDGLVRLIYTGTLAPYQDVDLLLEAFARAREVRPDLRLCFSVSSSFEPYEAAARRLRVLDAIEVLPDRFGELPLRLASAAIAVLPRTSCPGIPQKLLNYMAAAKPIVASAGSAKVLVHERTGLVVRNGDASGFADAVLRLAGDPELAEKLGRSARETVEKEFSWERAAQKLELVYDRLTARAQSARGEASGRRGHA